MIPLSEPNIGIEEKRSVNAVLKSGWVSTAGPQIEEFENAIAAFTHTKYAVATNSGTAALHLALLANNIQKGEIVLLPSIGFVAPLNAIQYVDAEPVLIDVHSDHLQIDAALFESFLERRTKMKAGKCRLNNKTISALLLVHSLGFTGELSKIRKLCRKYKILLIEDAAEALGSSIKDKQAGTFGTCGILSFNGNKIMTTGGGGMLITNSKSIAQSARHLAQQAKVFEYGHDESGYNYRMTNIAAAMGLAQIKKLKSFLAEKAAIHNRYDSAFRELENVRLMNAFGNESPNHWINMIRVPEPRVLQDFLHKKGIQSGRLWVPYSMLPHHSKTTVIEENFVAGDFYTHGLMIPSSTNLSKSDQKKVIEAIKSFGLKNR